MILVGLDYNGRRYCIECAKELDKVPVDERGQRTMTTLTKPFYVGEGEDKTCSECGDSLE